MPIYEFVCPVGHLAEVLRPATYTRHICDCGLMAYKRPSRTVQLNPPTGAALRSQFRLYQEATQEIGCAYDKAEAVEERSLPSPDLWSIAKTRAQNIVAAGEAPACTPPE